MEKLGPASGRWPLKQHRCGKSRILIGSYSSIFVYINEMAITCVDPGNLLPKLDAILTFPANFMIRSAGCSAFINHSAFESLRSTLAMLGPVSKAPHLPVSQSPWRSNLECFLLVVEALHQVQS